MNVTVRIFLTAVAIATAVYFFVTWHPEGLHEGDAVPAFTLQDASGKSVSLSDYAGKLVLVHFWATWCGTCMRELPEFNAMAAAYKDNPEFVILGLSLDDSGNGGAWKAVQALEKKIPLHFKVLMDSRAKVSDQFGTYALPETYLLDGHGHILRKFVGAQDWNAGAMRSYLNSEISKNSNQKK